MNIKDRITLDQLKSICDSAVAAGLGSWGAESEGPFTTEPALTAALSDLGVSGLIELDGDQLKQIEAFIAARTTTIEFERSIGTDETGAAIIETVNADVLIDGESFQVDLPHGGRWACDQEALRAALA